ncbi:Protein of unknown function [Gryllus bimaculatus]|nr:Protein of unknown function [Gryllus bimaculatus]
MLLIASRAPCRFPHSSGSARTAQAPPQPSGDIHKPVSLIAIGASQPMFLAKYCHVGVQVRVLRGEREAGRSLQAGGAKRGRRGAARREGALALGPFRRGHAAAQSPLIDMTFAAAPPRPLPRWARCQRSTAPALPRPAPSDARCAGQVPGRSPSPARPRAPGRGRPGGGAEGRCSVLPHVRRRCARPAAAGAAQLRAREPESASEAANWPQLARAAPFAAVVGAARRGGVGGRGFLISGGGGAHAPCRGPPHRLIARYLPPLSARSPGAVTRAGRRASSTLEASSARDYPEHLNPFATTPTSPSTHDDDDVQLRGYGTLGRLRRRASFASTW